MSIRDQINARMGEGRLYCLEPLIPSDPSMRTLFVTPEIYDEVSPPWPANWAGKRHSRFRETLDAFTNGSWIAIAERPFDKDAAAFMARVHPIIWNLFDIRAIDPLPGIRCLGGFAEQDTFVALTWNYREGFDWEGEIEACRQVWDDLLGPYKPLQGATINDYVSFSASSC